MTRADSIARIDADMKGIAELRMQAKRDPALAQRVGWVKTLQCSRLGRTYADLLASARYRAAARFFLSDLYGAQDFSDRDAGLARIVPAVERLLPDQALHALAAAIELHALSERLDQAVADHLDASCEMLAPSIDERAATECYVLAYRAAGDQPAREHQIELIGTTGRAMDRLVNVRLVHGVLRLMRGPARAAGLAALQSFLERGYDAFASMHGAAEFLADIDRRERAMMARMLAGELDPLCIARVC